MEKNDKLQWKVKHKSDFSNEIDFLETILLDCGVPADKLNVFLHPTRSCVCDPMMMKNMDKAIELVHTHIKNHSDILVRVDCDVDGFSSSATLIQFIKALDPTIRVDYKLNYEKRHGLSYDDMMNYTRHQYGLIIIPDASMTVKDARMITTNFSADILVLDHHIIENEFYNKNTRQFISKDEAKELWNTDKEALEVDCYTNYCTAVNCHDGTYPNPDLSGVGVVQKFIEGYVATYKATEEINEELTTKFLDLVSLGINADSMDLRSLENRYYVLEGMKERNYQNEFLNELVERNKEDMKWGRYITSMSWQVAPKINGVIRYGKDDEQTDTFRAMLGEQEDREYQPRRKSKYDLKPPMEIHSLQKTMARVCENVKSRQDNEVRKFVVEIEKEIEDNNLTKNSVLFVDGTKILTKGTVTGLVCNKLTGKYLRPVVLLRSQNAKEYGGSCRGYDKGNIPSIKEFLEKAGAIVHGHDNAGGVNIKKEQLQQVIANCNKMMPLSELCTIHTVDWEIPAAKLKKSYVQEVAENYAIWGTTVPEPLFAITDLRINANKIFGYGDTNSFIRFEYNGIPFIKKYCQHDEFDRLTLVNRKMFGPNTKELNINVIGQCVLNSYDGKIFPEFKILYFDSEEVKESNSNEDSKADDWSFETQPINIQVPKKRIVNPSDINLDDFDW